MVKTPPSNAGGVGSSPGRGTKVPHAMGCNQKFKTKQTKNQTNNDPHFAVAELVQGGKIRIRTWRTLISRLWRKTVGSEDF